MSDPSLNQSPTVDLKIRTTADTSGAVAAETELEKSALRINPSPTRRKTAEASNQASHSVKELGRSFHEGAQAAAIDGTSDALSGTIRQSKNARSTVY